MAQAMLARSPRSAARARARTDAIRWHDFLEILFGPVLAGEVDRIEQRYVQDGVAMALARRAGGAHETITAVLDMVEARQRWDNELVRFWLFTQGTSAERLKSEWSGDALALVAAKGLKEPAAVVAETVRVIRHRQRWDSLRQLANISEA